MEHKKVTDFKRALAALMIRHNVNLVLECYWDGREDVHTSLAFDITNDSTLRFNDIASTVGTIDIKPEDLLKC